ncbi:hypothetical protein [Moraxella catarrhalis]|nr:hypothetical protein [Moraxella catarrhalis]
MQNHFKFKHATSLSNAINIMKTQNFICHQNIGDYVLNGYIEKNVTSPANSGVIIEFTWLGEVEEIYEELPEKDSVLYLDWWRCAIRPPYLGDNLLITDILLHDEEQLSQIDISIIDKFKIMFKSKFFKKNIDDLEKQYRLKYIASLHNFDAGIKIHIPDWQNYYKKLN